MIVITDILWKIQIGAFGKEFAKNFMLFILSVSSWLGLWLFLCFNWELIECFQVFLEEKVISDPDIFISVERQISSNIYFIIKSSVYRP